MIVVSDTSPLTSLLTIGQIELLEKLFGSVVIPPAVADELRRRHQDWPPFIREVALSDRSSVARLSAKLHLGEAQAIVLAKELRADALLIDELVGRTVAQREGVPVVGLLGVCGQRATAWYQP